MSDDIDPDLVDQMYRRSRAVEGQLEMLEHAYRRGLRQLADCIVEFGEIAAGDARRFGPVGTFVSRLYADPTMTREALVGMCAIAVEQIWTDAKEGTSHDRPDR